MKKIILVTILSLLLSIPSLALGNDYEFTDLWWQSCFIGSSFRSVDTGGVSSSGSNGSVNTTQLRFNNVIHTNLLSGENLTYTYVKNDVLNKSYINFYVPASLIVEPDETLRASFSLVIEPSSYYYGEYNNVSVGCTLAGSTSAVKASTTKTYYSDLDIVVLNLNSNGAVSSIDTIVEGKGFVVDVSYTNTTDEPVSVGVFNILFETNSSPRLNTVYFGSLSSGNQVTLLPSYVESNLTSISNTLLEQLAKVSEIYNLMSELDLALSDINLQLILGNAISDESLAEIKSISEKIDELSSALGVSGGVSQNIYNYITQATPESSESVDRLQEAVSEAQEELASMKETIDTVIAPTLADIDQANQDINVSISESLTSKEASDILSSLFENSMLINMMLIVISFATVGYVLYGKR